MQESDNFQSNPLTESGSSPPSIETLDSEGKSQPRLLTVSEAARFLSLSESWVRRHVSELPFVRVGGAIRFDSALLQRHFSGTISIGKPPKQASQERVRMLQRNQQGYVYKRGATRVWYGRYREDSLTPDGQIVRRTRNVRLGTLIEVPSKAAAAMKLHSIMAVQKPKTKMTFAQLHRRWQVAEVPTIKRTTANYYQKILSAHVLPVFGHREIDQISREEVQVFLAEKAPKYRMNTLRGMRVSLGKVLSWAVECGWLEKNPCSGIKLPDAGREEAVHKALTGEQISAIVGKLEEPYATLVLLLAVTGLRIGEAIGIKWSDFDGDVLRVNRTIYDGRPQSPKTKKSIRCIPVPQRLLDRMKKLGNGEYIFRSRVGTPVNPGNALKRYIRPVAQELGIELSGWHDFRRTVATSLLRSGESPKLVSDILGNSVDILLKDYDLPNIENFRGPLNNVAGQLLPIVTKLPLPA
jgi:integrase